METTLAENYKKLYIGYPFKKRVKLLPADLGSRAGNGQASVRRIDRANIKVYLSKGGRYSIIEEHIGEDSRISATEYSLVYNYTDNNKLETKDHLVDMQSLTDRRQSINIEEDDPLKPLNILAIVFRGYIGDE